MDLDARPYRSFLAIADSGSFSRAAGALNLSQPALSAQIKEFERRLGFSLFSRSSRRVVLTTEGSLFLDRARRLVVETDAAVAAARDIRSNQLRIGVAHHTAEIPERNDLIDNFLVEAPDVPLRVLRRSPAQLVDDLESGAVDLTIKLEFEDQASGVPAAPVHDSWKIAARPLRLWVPSDHALLATPVIQTRDLESVSVGMIDRSHGVSIAEGVGAALRRSGAILHTLPEGDARAVRRQCARLGLCAIDLGWYPADDDRMRSQAVEEWRARTVLTVSAKIGDRREGARRFLRLLEVRPL